VFLWYDNFLARAQKRHAPWAEIEEYRRLPLACLGGPLYVISLFWLGWSSYGNVHWIVPMLSGVTFGMGFMLIFMVGDLEVLPAFRPRTVSLSEQRCHLHSFADFEILHRPCSTISRTRTRPSQPAHKGPQVHVEVLVEVGNLRVLHAHMPRTVP